MPQLIFYITLHIAEYIYIHFNRNNIIKYRLWREVKNIKNKNKNITFYLIVPRRPRSKNKWQRILLISFKK